MCVHLISLQSHALAANRRGRSGVHSVMSSKRSVLHLTHSTECEMWKSQRNDKKRRRKQQSVFVYIHLPSHLISSHPSTHCDHSVRAWWCWCMWLGFQSLNVCICSGCCNSKVTTPIYHTFIRTSHKSHSSPHFCTVLHHTLQYWVSSFTFSSQLE